MTGFLPRTARFRRLPGRVPGLAAATALGLLSVAACTSPPSFGAGATAGATTGASAVVTGAATAGATTGATPAASPVAGPSGAATADCDSVATCYTPRQLQVAYAGHRLGFVNPAIYRIAHGPEYHQAFHDITTGNNAVEFPPRTITGYAAGPSWDPVTGWGSPDARILVPLLAR